MEGFYSRLRRWFAKAWQSLRKRLWLIVVLLLTDFPLELIKERVVHRTNAFLDAHTNVVLSTLRPTILYLLSRPLKLVILVCLFVVLAHIVHAYWETRERIPVPPAVKAPGASAVSSERIYVQKTITPSYLVSFHTKHMSKDADMMLAPYIGKWIRTSCIVRNIYHEDDDAEHGYAVIADYLQVKGNSAVGLHLYFGQRWGARIMMLKRNDKIGVVGKIAGCPVAGLVNLENCELEL